MELFINIIKAIVFGIVEGITEWLPISSTAHLLILEEWLSFDKTFGQPFVELFVVVIQFGAIIAVLITFFKKLWPFGLESKDESKKRWLLIGHTILACVPGVIGGLFLDDIKDKYLSGVGVIVITLIVFGLMFIGVETYLKKTNKTNSKELSDLNIKTALIIGFSQMIALIPGVSRSGITIITALLLGFSRTAAAEFSFIMSIPMIIGASGYKTLKFFLKGQASSVNNPGSASFIMIVGIIVAFVVSLLTIKYFMSFLKKKSFIGFGYYRIGLAIVLLILILTDQVVAFSSLVQISPRNFLDVFNDLTSRLIQK